jgi:hypothetical protein
LIDKLFRLLGRQRGASVPAASADKAQAQDMDSDKLPDKWPNGKAPPHIRQRGIAALKSLVLMFASVVALSWMDGSAKSAFFAGAFFLLFLGFIVAVGWISLQFSKLHRNLGTIIGAVIILAAFAALAVWFLSNWGR